jgi:sigma54-dependent transcription regulator
MATHRNARRHTLQEAFREQRRVRSSNKASFEAGGAQRGDEVAAVLDMQCVRNAGIAERIVRMQLEAERMTA